MENKPNSRRSFFAKSAVLTAGIAAAPLLSHASPLPTYSEGDLYLVGPQKGYSPHVGSMLSMMTMMRAWVMRHVEDLSIAQLDFQIDEESNSIGAMLLHLAATEKYYQLHTFNEMAWGSWGADIKKEWDVPMNLGKAGREKIKGNKIDYYLTKLKEVRANTEREFAKRDDDWLQKSDVFFENQPTNNYCKWFHVCEHESNHLGQIKFIKKRFPA